MCIRDRVKAVYHRYTSAYDDQGKEAASVDSRWILVDTQTRRILRKIPENFHFPFLTEQVPEHPCKLVKSECMEHAGEQSAVYSKAVSYTHLDVYKRQAVYQLDHQSDEAGNNQLGKIDADAAEAP